MARDLPLLELEGGPRDWGFGHGRDAEARVRDNVSLYRQRFLTWAKISPEALRRRSQAYAEVIGKANPSYYSAMEGIAEGSGQDFLDIVAVNVRYEIMYSEFVERGMSATPLGVEAVGGCSSFAIAPPQSENGHLLLGQNWDWIPEVRGLLVLARAPDGSTQLAFTEAGIAGAKIGLNSSGIGLAVNGLVSNLDTWSRLRKPFHLRCWEVLRAKDFDQAAQSVVGEPRACSANFVLVQAGAPAKIADFEAAPEGACRIEATEGFVTHTNHFLDPDRLGIWQPLAEDRVSTFRRYERMRSVLARQLARGRKIRIADLKRILRDHDGTPDCICRHADPTRVPEERFETVVSVIMDLDAKEMHVAPGTPCTNRYIRHQLLPGAWRNPSAREDQRF